MSILCIHDDDVNDLNNKFEYYFMLQLTLNSIDFLKFENILKNFRNCIDENS